MKDYYNIKDIIKIDAKQQIRKGFKKWGIERTEDKIKYHYHFYPKALKLMLTCYREIIEGKSDLD